jgi:hypothetical protein
MHIEVRQISKKVLKKFISAACIHKFNRYFLLVSKFKNQTFNRVPVLVFYELRRKSPEHFYSSYDMARIVGTLCRIDNY